MWLHRGLHRWCLCPCPEYKKRHLRESQMVESCDTPLRCLDVSSLVDLITRRTRLLRRLPASGGHLLSAVDKGRGRWVSSVSLSADLHAGSIGSCCVGRALSFRRHTGAVPYFCRAGIIYLSLIPAPTVCDTSLPSRARVRLSVFIEDCQVASAEIVLLATTPLL